MFVAHLQRKLYLSYDDAAILSRELIDRFLPIKRYLRDLDDTICSPSPQLDAAWCELILFTKYYAKLCGKLFVHYDPLSELDEVSVKVQKYNRTLAAYEELFGTPPADKKIWPVAYPGSTVTNDNKTDDNDGGGGDEVAIPSSTPTFNKKRKIDNSPSKEKIGSQQVISSESQVPIAAVGSATSSNSAVGSVPPSSSERLHIFVRDGAGELTGFNVSSSVTFGRLAALVAGRMDIDVPALNLLVDGERQDPHRTLAECGIHDEHVLDALLNQGGC